MRAPSHSLSSECTAGCMAQATQHCAARGRNATAFQSSDSSFFGPPPFGVNRAAMLQENASAACSLPGIPARGPWMADLGSLASGPRSDVGSLAGGPIGPRLAINNYYWGQKALVFIGMSVLLIRSVPHRKEGQREPTDRIAQNRHSDTSCNWFSV